MRRTASIALLSTLVPVGVALPVVSRPAAAPRPVAPVVREIPVAGVDAAAERAMAVERVPSPAATGPAAAGPGASGGPLLLIPATRTEPFTTLGLTWEPGSAAGDVRAEVRTRSGGRWTGWSTLFTDSEDVPDAGSPDTEGDNFRDGSAPKWTGRSDGVQVRLYASSGRAPRDVRLALIDPGTSPADAAPTGRVPASTATAQVVRPAVVTRAQWGADESMRSHGPYYSATVKVGFVHHTDTSNSYSPSDSPAMIRSVYAYHTRSRGWSDIGYNFLVDRFGVAFEGRFGGMERAVVGAHTGGFNTDSFAVSLLGNFVSDVPPAAMLSRLQAVLAWKLGLHHRDPLASEELVSAGHATSKYPAGTRVRFAVVSGHRDAGLTTCPGEQTYIRLPAIRSAVRLVMGAGLVAPSVSAPSAVYRGTGVVVRAGTLRPQTWQLDIIAGCSGAVVRRLTGTSSTAVAAVWDLRTTAGGWARADTYRMTLTSSIPGNAAVPWTTTFSITGTATAPPATSTSPAAEGPATYVPVTPTRLLDTRSGIGQPGSTAPVGPGDRRDLTVLGTAGIPTSGVAAVAVNVAGTCTTGGTFLTAYPSGSQVPSTSSVNLAAGQTAATMVVSAVGADGRISVRNALGYADVVVDLLGYYPTSAAGLRYHPVTAVRAVDTRLGAGGVASGEQRTYPLAGRFGLPPAGAGAVMLNITAVGATAPGWVSAYPAGTARPATSNVNFARGQAVGNRVVTGLSADGSFSIYNGSRGATHLVIDVVGWYAGPTVAHGYRYWPLQPDRLLDTRTGIGGPAGPVGPTAVRTWQLTGRSGVPASGVTAVVMTVTATQPTAPTHLTVFPGSQPRPATSDLNVAAGQTVANLVVVPVGPDGQFSVYNYAGSTHVIADVLGFYAS